MPGDTVKGAQQAIDVQVINYVILTGTSEVKKINKLLSGTTALW